MHTPRVCIDAREKAGLTQQGMNCQELINQMISSIDEPSAHSDWFEKRRVVLLCNSGQVFSGQFKRHETRRRAHNGMLSRLWEKRFLKHASISLFHRFQTPEHLKDLGFPVLSTVLPSNTSQVRASSEKQWFAVPSLADKNWLQTNSSIAEERIFKVTPSPRRLVYHTNPILRVKPKTVVVLVDKNSQSLDLKFSIPHVFVVKVDVNDLALFGDIKRYWRFLSDACLAVYAVSSKMDWAFPFWELAYWKIPTYFADDNATISEMLPDSPMRLSRLGQHDQELDQMALQTHETLSKKGVFDPHALASQYSKIYEGLLKEKGPVFETGP